MDQLKFSRVSDILMFFTKDLTLRFNVNLTKKNSHTNKIEPITSVYPYANMEGNQVASINRFIDPYFSIVDATQTDFNLKSIILRPQDVYILIRILKESVLPWYIGNNDIFQDTNEGGLAVNATFNQPIYFSVDEYCYLRFDPCVTQDYITGKDDKGVRIEINSNDHVFESSVDNIFKLYYYLQNTDMYNAAIGLINFSNSQFNAIETKYNDTPFSNNNSSSNNNKNFFNNH